MPVVASSILPVPCCGPLNVANCMAPREHKIVAMSIKLRAQHLDVHDSMLPQSTQRLSDEDVLDNVLAQ